MHIPPDLEGNEQTLRDAVAALPDAEILVLCFALGSKRERLRLYADMLRRRGGGRAQFASCLICFDLARQGDVGAQREFALLAPTMRALSAQTSLVRSLIGSDPYLCRIWDLCRAALLRLEDDALTEAGGDEGLAAALLGDDLQPGEPPPPNVALPLLQDADFSEFSLPSDDATLQARLDAAVDAFLGGVPGVPAYAAGAGFRLRHGRDVQRIERFLTQLGSLRDTVPQARGYRALVLLFYGSQLRSRTLFGGVNQRKQALLRAGLREFMQSGPQVYGVVGVLGPLHSDAGVWDKIAEVLVDFIDHLKQDPHGALRSIDASLQAYQPVGRLRTRF